MKFMEAYLVLGIPTICNDADKWMPILQNLQYPDHKKQLQSMFDGRKTYLRASNSKV